MPSLLSSRCRCFTAPRRIRLTGPHPVLPLSSTNVIIQHGGIHTLPNSTSQSPFTRLSTFWLASGGITATENEGNVSIPAHRSTLELTISTDTHAKLIRAGYLRQVSSPPIYFMPMHLSYTVSYAVTCRHIPHVTPGSEGSGETREVNR